MSDRITFLRIAELTLEKEKKPLSPTEIWILSEPIRNSTGYKSEGLTPSKSIGSQLYSDTQRPDSVFYKAGMHPARFYLKKYRTDSQHILEAEPLEQRRPSREFEERDLHPLLVKFVKGDEHFHAVAEQYFTRAHRRDQKGKTSGFIRIS